MPATRSSPAELIRTSWVIAALFTAAALLALTTLHLITVARQTGPDLIAPNGMPVGADFIAFWSAAWLTVTGNAVGAHDLATIGAVEKMAVPAGDALTPWLYPPTFLLVLWPLGYLGYVKAWLVFVSLTLTLMLGVLYRLRPHWSTPLLVLAYPALWLNVLSGQNAFITTTLMALAFLTLPAHPYRAGGWIGLLSYKPQLGLLWPVVLIADRQWRVIAAAAVTAGLLALLSLAVFGPALWQAFIATLHNPLDYLEQGRIPLERMVSTFSMIRQAGWSPQAAYAGQLLMTLLALCITAALWSARGVAANVRAASLSIAVLMATPHVFHYDLTVLVLALLLWLREAESTRWLPGERPVLYLTWLAPVILLPLAYDTGLGLYPLLYIVLQLMLLRRARSGSAS